MVTCLLACCPWCAQAGNGDTHNIDFTFRLIQPTCVLATPSPSVALEQLTARDLASAAVGTIAHPKPVTLSVTGCVDVTSATFTFQANPDPTAQALFATTGTGSGVGIDLRTTGDGIPVRADGTANTRSATILPDGTGAIALQVSYARNGEPTIGPGTISAAIVFEATYN